MDKEEAFVHKVTTKIAIVLQQGKLSEIDGTYDASLVDGCKQQCREYLKMVTERRSDLLPSRISLEAAKKAYSGSHFDWHDFEEVRKYAGWMAGILQSEENYRA